MPQPTVSRQGTTPVTPQTPQTDTASTGTTARPSSTNALVRFQGAALPNRRPSIDGAEGSTSTAGTSASGAIATTRRRSTNALAKSQTERAAAAAAQQIEQALMKEIGSLEPADVQAYFETAMPRLFGATAPAQARLQRLFADAGIADGTRIVADAMQAVDRAMTAAIDNGEGTSTALQRTPQPADQAAIQRMMDALAQVSASAPTVDTAPDTGRIHELEDDQAAERFLAGDTSASPPSSGATSIVAAPSLGGGDSLSITRVDTPPIAESEHPSVAGTDGGESVHREFAPEEVDRAVNHVSDFLKSIPGLMERLTSNRDFDSKAAQWAATTFNVLVRNLASVGVTTFGRELLAYAVEIALERNGVSKPVRSGISALAGPGYSTMTHLAGAVRDVMHGGASKEDLRNALIGRSVSILTAAGAAYAEHAYDLGHTTTATHVAMTAYTHARDVGVQSWLRLPAAQNPAEDKTHFAFMSVFYGLDQAVVPGLMMLLAPKSGAGAARAGLSLGETAKNAAIRGALNMAGEAAEDLANEGNRAIRAGHAPEVGLQVDVKQRHFVNGLLGPQSVRTAIISEAQSLVPLVAMAAAERGWSGAATVLATAAMIGGINGVQYWPFAVGFGAQPKVGAPPADEENGVHLDTLATTQPLPDPAVPR